MKCEPDDMSLEEFAALPNRVAGWDGVRNYQARNIMKVNLIGLFFVLSGFRLPKNEIQHFCSFVSFFKKKNQLKQLKK